jgi:hypothetical protein
MNVSSRILTGIPKTGCRNGAIFLDTPDYPEIVYQSDNSLFERAEAERKNSRKKTSQKHRFGLRKNFI